jgi:hypothetical protein
MRYTGNLWHFRKSFVVVVVVVVVLKDVTCDLILQPTFTLRSIFLKVFHNCNTSQ